MHESSLSPHFESVENGVEDPLYKKKEKKYSNLRLLLISFSLLNYFNIIKMKLFCAYFQFHLWYNDKLIQSKSMRDHVESDLRWEMTTHAFVRWHTQFDPLAQSHNAVNGTGGGGADRKTAARFRMPTRAASRSPCPLCPYTRLVALLTACVCTLTMRNTSWIGQRSCATKRNSLFPPWKFSLAKKIDKNCSTMMILILHDKNLFFFNGYTYRCATRSSSKNLRSG